MCRQIQRTGSFGFNSFFHKAPPSALMQVSTQSQRELQAAVMEWTDILGQYFSLSVSRLLMLPRAIAMSKKTPFLHQRVLTSLTDVISLGMTFLWQNL